MQYKLHTFVGVFVLFICITLLDSDVSDTSMFEKEVCRVILHVHDTK